ncbi:MAG: ATP-binding protein [Candidatus Ozemobacteraceae bacterium]
MTRFFDSLPIKAKLVLIIMFTSLFSVSLVGATVIIYDNYYLKQDLIHDISAIGRLIADRSTAALAFQDARLAEENLKAIHLKPSVIAACIFNEQGAVFAKYRTAAGGSIDFRMEDNPVEYRFDDEHLSWFGPIFLESKRTGTIFICADLDEFHSRHERFMLLVAVIVLFSSMVAFALSSRLQRYVSAPLLHLTLTAQQITSQKDYSLRAVKSSDDEIGLLVIAFNEMLVTINQQNEEMKILNAELEERVNQRTALLEVANKELEAFTYSVSHDLRAPLRHIDGFVELLVRRFKDSLPEKAQYYLSTIADSARQMGMLIDDLLQFSRTGRAEMRKSSIDLNPILKEVQDSLRRDYSGRRIEWIMVPLPMVFCDGALLKQVWVNLLSNAVKFTRKRKDARIEIGFHEVGEEFVFFVRDNGVGFDMQYSQKLFGVFQRFHSTEEFEGTGIGLANVRRIILRHGGRTWGEGEPDQGATFHFTLPRHKEERP